MMPKPFPEEIHMHRFISFNRCLPAALLMLCATLLPADAIAQGYPNKPIKMVTGYAPGGTSDILARLMAQQLNKSLGQTVIVDNRPGAGGNIGTDFVAKSAPDGYTLVMGASGPLAINMSLFAKMPYDNVKDLAPIAQVAAVPLVLVVHPTVTAKNLKELIAAMKAKPNDFSFGSAGNGTPQHLSGELFKSMAGGLDITHIPYKGTGPALSDLLGGQIKVMFETTIAVLPHIKAGKLRAIAVTTGTRSPELPDVPTIAESGVPGYESIAWYGMAAPAGTPREIITKLNAETVKIMKSPEISKRLKEMGSHLEPGSPEQFAAFIKAETAKWAKVVKESGAKVD
jgi:tripartite-type tricarboxylate transporter receptor subunit TctC